MRRSHRGDAPVYGAAEGDDRRVLRPAWTGGAGDQYGESGGIYDQGAGGGDAEAAAGVEIAARLPADSVRRPEAPQARHNAGEGAPRLGTQSPLAGRA